MKINSKKILILTIIIAAIVAVCLTYKWNEGGMMVGNNYYRPGYFFSGKEKALAIAAEKGDIKEIDRLVKQGANVNAVGKSKNGKDIATILQWATVSWKKGAKNVKAIELLLQLGADPNLTTKDGTSVMFVVGTGESTIPLLELLLKHGGNPNIRDPVENNILSNNTTVLIRAAQLGRFENIKFLLQHGASIDLQDGFGMTALLWAASNRYFDIAYYLLQQGADYKIYGYRPLMLYHTPENKLGIYEVLKDSLRGGLSDDEIPWREKVIKWLEAHGIAMPSADS